MAIAPEVLRQRMLISAQLVVSSVLTGASLTFATQPEVGHARTWRVNSKASPDDPDILLTLSLAPDTFAVESAVTYGELDLSALYWELPERIPFVRIEREEPADGDPKLAFIRFETPLDVNPPHLLPHVVQAGMQAVFAATMWLITRYPDEVKPHAPGSTRLRVWSGDAGAALQAEETAAEPPPQPTR